MPMLLGFIYFPEVMEFPGLSVELCFDALFGLIIFCAFWLCIGLLTIWWSGYKVLCSWWVSHKLEDAQQILLQQQQQALQREQQQQQQNQQTRRHNLRPATRQRQQQLKNINSFISPMSATDIVLN